MMVIAPFVLFPGLFDLLDIFLGEEPPSCLVVPPNDGK
jgi:hypothetical protein